MEPYKVFTRKQVWLHTWFEVKFALHIIFVLQEPFSLGMTVLLKGRMPLGEVTGCICSWQAAQVRWCGVGNGPSMELEEVVWTGRLSITFCMFNKTNPSGQLFHCEHTLITGCFWTCIPFNLFWIGDCRSHLIICKQAAKALTSENGKAGSGGSRRAAPAVCPWMPPKGVCVQEGVTGHGASIPQLVAILKQESQLLPVPSVQPPGVICHPLVLYNFGG